MQKGNRSKGGPRELFGESSDTVIGTEGMGRGEKNSPVRRK